MKTYKEDVTFKYYDMINSFRADNTIKIKEVEENEISFDKSFFEIEKYLIKNKSESYFRDIDLLEELEFELRHENLKIVSVNKNLKEKDNEIDRLNNIINELEKELREGSFDVYFCSTNTQKTFKSNEIIIKSLILDKLKELKENK